MPHAKGVSPPRWTAEEDRILRETWTTEGLDAAHAKLPRRTRSAVENHAHVLELPPSVNSRLWTEEEERLLRELAVPGTTWVEVAKCFPRHSVTGVKQYAANMGLYIYQKELWTKEDDTLIREHYALKGGEGMKPLLPKRSVTAITVRASKMGLVYVAPLWTDEEEAALRDCYVVWPSSEDLTRRFPGRTVIAIRGHARALGLRKRGTNTPWTIDEDALLADNLEASPDALRTLLSQRGWPAIRARRQRLREASRSPTENGWTEEDDTILRETYPLKGSAATFRALPHFSHERILYRVAQLRLACALRHDAWMVDEDAVLRARYEIEGPRPLRAVLPNRSLQAIQGHARTIGLKFQRKLWSDVEVAILTRYYPMEGVQATVQRLPRWSVLAVRQKAATLRLIAPSKCWTAEEDRIMREKWPEGGMRVVRPLLPRRKKYAILARRETLGIVKKIDPRRYWRQVLHTYQDNAESRGRVWELSFAEAKALFTSSCHYCGGLPSNQLRRAQRSGPTIPYQGIDRVDNTLGYTRSNSVACCYVCNRAKNAMTYEEFAAWLDRLVWFRRECRGNMSA